jgi:putative membrane protein
MIVYGWQLDPVLIGSLLAAAVSYGLAVGPLRYRLAPRHPFPTAQAGLFYLGLGVIYLAEGSPLHDIAERYLLSAHMTQHLILSYVVPPLLLGGLPSWVLRPLLLNRLMAPISKVLTAPVVAFAVFTLFFSFWHLPPIYEGALRNEALHHLEHVVFLLTALLLWWPLLSPLAELPRLSYFGQLLYIFLLPIAQLPVFGLITFAHEPIYPTYANAPRLWIDSPLADQTLAGAIMKVAGLLTFGLRFVLIFLAWYRDETMPKGRRRLA